MMPNNDLPERSKETEIGPIPVDWEVKPVGEISEVITGRTPSTKESRYWDNGTIPFITPVDLQGGPIRNAARTITQDGLEASRPLPQGTVVISCIGYIGKVGVVDAPVAVTNQQINAVIPKEDQADNWYLAYAMMHLEPLLNDRARMTTVPILNKSNFQGIPVSLPPLPEQRRIAHVLSTIQRAIAAQDDLIAAAREVKRSLMQRLFTYGPGPEPAPTKETEIGEIPEHWEVVQVGDFVEMKYGYRTSIPKEPPPSGVKIISTAEILGEGRLDLAKIRTVEMPAHLVERYTVQRDDLLFNWRNAPKHVGKTAIVEFTPREPMVFASFIIRIRTLDRLNHRFLHFLTTYLRDRGRFVRLSRRAVNQANFNANELAELQIPLPELDEQERIDQMLSGAERKIKTGEQRKAALQALFKAMLHQLMTGQIRLRDVE
jgi:type I restriction enzyme S subunit